MKKLLAAFAATAALSITGANAAETLSVAATPVPHAEILNFVKPILAKEGVELKVKEFTDYVQPNTQVAEKRLDANFFQHQPYLDEFNKSKGTSLVAVTGVHIEPLGAYSSKYKKLDELPSGATVVIPNDATNGGRALLLLAKTGLIKLKDEKSITATPKDITDNPKNIKVRELEAATLPRVLGRLHPSYGVPRPAMWFNLAVSFLFLFFFRGWGTLAAVISVATIISYLTGPVSVMTLRRTAPDMHRPFRLAALPVLAGIGFVMATELLYWAKWPLTGQIILLMAVALPVYLYYQWRGGWHDFGRQMRGAWWLIAYLPAIAAVSWAGSARFGGRDYLTWGWDLAVVAVIALAFYLWGVRSGWRTASIEAARADLWTP